MTNNQDAISDSTRIFYKRRKNIVGLLNQGGTCYLNSLLQTLFHTPEFTYRLFNLASETQQKTNLKSIIRELLRLFYNLMTISKFAISSKSLTNSFGWSDEQLYVHQDVQELNRLLFEEIETSLKGTVEANLINDIYKGIIVTKIRCLRCGYCSVREDEYLDVNLAVLEYDSVEKALRGLTAIERLNGDNQYFCDKCQRKVDANKFAYFKEYPPILTLCLARFDFDPRTMQSIKVDKCCSFPLVLDVAEFMDRKQNKKILYDLFSIVIHVGNSTLGGHYHAYIKDPYGFEINSEANENNIDSNKFPPTLLEKRDFSQCFTEKSGSPTPTAPSINPSSFYNHNKVSTDFIPQDVDDNNDNILDDQDDDRNNTRMSGDNTNSDTEKHQSLLIPSTSPKKLVQNNSTSTLCSSGSTISNGSTNSGSNKFSAIFDAIRSLWSSGSSNTNSNSGSVGSNSKSQVNDHLNHASLCTSFDLHNEHSHEIYSTKSISPQRIPPIEHYSLKPRDSVHMIDTNNNEPMEYEQNGLISDILMSEQTDNEHNVEMRDLHPQNDNTSNIIDASNNINSSQQTEGRVDSKSSTSKPTPTTSWSSMTKLKFKKGTDGENDDKRKSSNSDSNTDNQDGNKSSNKKTKTRFIDKGRWFDFNDESITEIKANDFQKVYAGQECAYILFYRSRQPTVFKR